LGGLDIAALDVFDGPLPLPHGELEKAQESLREVRAEMVQRLHGAIHGATDATRRALLRIKRDCFNGRPIARHAGTEIWRQALVAAPKLAQEILRLESLVDLRAKEFHAAYELQREHEQEGIRSILRRPGFRCGLAMASPQLAASADRLLAKAPAAYRRREQRLLSTLLRYISRTALKTSPFSTLTPLAMGRLSEVASEVAGTAQLRLLGQDWQQRSLVRLRRHLLDRCQFLLLGYAPFKAGLELAINTSLKRTDSGRYSFLRAARWRVDDTGKTLIFEEEALLTVGLTHPAVACLQRHLEAAPIPYGQLLEHLAAKCFSRDPSPATPQDLARQTLDRLLDLSFLCPRWPWAVHAGHLEKDMLQSLRRLSPDPHLDHFCAILERLLNLQDGLLSSPQPASDRHNMEGLLQPLLRSAARLGSVPDSVVVDDRWTRSDIYQDVWLHAEPPKEQAGEEALVDMDRSSALEALASIEPIVRYTHLLDPKHDFLLSLAALVKERWPDRPAVPLIEVLGQALPLWKDFAARSEQPATDGCWNPLRSPQLEKLSLLRERARKQLAECCRDGLEGRRIDGARLNAWLDQLPPRLGAAQAGPCLFLQPASTDGSQWMLNRLKEGTGRFASRYSPLLPSPQQARYLELCRQHSSRMLDGERVELLDMQSTQGDTLNVHDPLTHSVLILPGDHSTIAPSRQVHLQDLQVVLASDGWPELRDRQGQRYLPVHLGVAFAAYMPMPIRFLSTFGPSEMGAHFPPPWVHEQGELRVSERTLIGNLVLHRRSWTFHTKSLIEAIDLATESASFGAIEHWRHEHGIPRRVFAIEQVQHAVAGQRGQPQYVDLGSPTFLDLFVSILKAAPQLTLSECLPGREMFPLDSQGRRWALELMLDARFLAP
jgi:hypothetical protein